MTGYNEVTGYEVAGKIAVVTGAASGIGLGMARALTDAGMSLVAADIEVDRLRQVVDDLRSEGKEVIGVVTDVTDEAQVDALAEATLREYGAVHVVANNAGVGAAGPVDEMSLDEWRWILDVNLWGAIHGVRSFLPLLKAQGEGHISATSSVAGLVSGPMLGAYHVAKHGVVGLMETVRSELALAESPVRSSVLCPGPVDTDVVRSDRNRPDHLVAHEAGHAETRFWSRLVATLADGMAPDEVGALFLDAVRNERFWVLTHPEEHLPMVDSRLESIRNDHQHRRT